MIKSAGKRLLLTFVICVYFSTLVLAEGNAKKDLEAYSEEQCISFLSDKGIQLPDEDKALWSAFFYQEFCNVLNNYEYYPAFGRWELMEFSLRIKEVVLTEIDYYSHKCQNEEKSADQLKDSIKIANWDNSYLYFNCYVYSILGSGLNSHNPGFYSGTSINLNTCTIDAMASAVCADLQSASLGYQCACWISSYPTGLAAGQRVICCRKGNLDYHFMRKNGSYWDHKPGDTNIIRFKYEPYEKNWTNEGIKGSGDTYLSGGYTYSGNIRYIIISNSHSYTTGSDGSQYCIRCGMIAPEEDVLSPDSVAQ